ncbi:MAG: hypothetical protein ACR2J4_02480, partial [Deinococcus sp.]
MHRRAASSAASHPGLARLALWLATLLFCFQATRHAAMLATGEPGQGVRPAIMGQAWEGMSGMPGSDHKGHAPKVPGPAHSRSTDCPY